MTAHPPGPLVELVPAGAPGAAADRDRGRAWVPRAGCSLAAIVLLGAGLLAGTVGSARFDGTATVSFAGGARAVTLPQFGERGSHVLAYAHGGSVAFSFPIVNGGRVPVTVTGVRLSREPLSMLQAANAAVGADELPVTLRPGQSAVITMSARYGNCRYYHEREVELLSAVIVDAEVLGFGITREVPFDHDLVIRSPMVVDCPDRTLDRGDDIRPGG